MWLWRTASWLILVGEVALCGPVGYLATVALAALWRSHMLARRRREEKFAVVSAASTRFAIVIPAHDEELVIGSLLESIKDLDYPPSLFAAYIIADNCTDDTVGVVKRAGVGDVLIRQDSERRGKGYALAWGFEQLLRCAPSYDAFVVIDADSVVDPHLLSVFARALGSGAPAVQASYMVLNTIDSPATVLRWVALTLMNYVRPLGRNGIGGSSTLPGNGMCFSRELLQRQPWSAFGLTEDYEYYLTITLAGETVQFAPEAVVRALMPTTFGAMRTQDLRWEASGQKSSTWTWALRLVSTGVRLRDWRRLEAALELLTPPLSQVIALVAISVLLGAGLALGQVTFTPLIIATCLVIGLGVYLGSALYLLHPPVEAYRALFVAPRFIIWKLWVSLVARHRHGAQGEWVRTERAPAARR